MVLYNFGGFCQSICVQCIQYKHSLENMKDDVPGYSDEAISLVWSRKSNHSLYWTTATLSNVISKLFWKVW